MSELESWFGNLAGVNANDDSVWRARRKTMANNSLDMLSGQMRVIAEYWRGKGGAISVGTVFQFADTAERLEERIRLLEQFAESLSGLREGCLGAYAGGYTHSGDEDKLRIFQHGMNTVCNVVQARLNSLSDSPATASPDPSPGRIR